jgi:hypothetical protein
MSGRRRAEPRDDEREQADYGEHGQPDHNDKSLAQFVTELDTQSAADHHPG